MRLLLIFVSLLFAVRSECAPSGASMDTPLVFKDKAAILAYFGGSAPDAVHPRFTEAETYVYQYAFHNFTSREGNDDLYFSYINGQTPRRIMLLGFSLRLEVLRRSRLEDELRIASKTPSSCEESFDESLKLYKHRILECQMLEQICEKMILELSKPNQALQHNDPSCHVPCVRTDRASRGRG